MAYILEKIGNTYNLPKKYFTCDAKSDLDGISLVDVPIGSEAYCILEEESYILDSNKQWHKKKIGEDLTGQVQANLSQIDSTQADYVKGVLRTEHLPEGYPYKGIGTILDGTFEFADRNGIYLHQIIDEGFTIIDSKSYTVIWDGETYQCVATTVDNGLLALGNLAIAGAGSDTGEPFLFSDGMIAANNTAATHTITVRGEIVYPIASEFLPKGYPYKGIGTILDGTFEFVDRNGIYLHQIIDEGFTIIDSKSYTVIWDGTTYQYVATTVGNGLLALGNLAIAGDGADTGEPFLFSDRGDGQKLVGTNSTAATHTITIRREIVYPIASEFLPDEYVTETELASKGYLTSYTETDPTVPAWAKAETKPSYDFSELTVNDPEAAKTALAIEKGVILKNFQAAMPSTESWNSVTYGNGKFVAIVFSNFSTKAAYSVDGITWTATTMPSKASWNSVTYGNGKFVALANLSPTAAYSVDGITWTATTMPNSDNWQSVTYGNGKFVAVASMSRAAAYSVDGITWTATTMPSKASWNSVTYGNGKFVAIVFDSNTAAYSVDGITWSSSTMPSTAKWWPISYGNGKFVAIADDSDTVAYSEDGINWIASTLPISRYWRSVTYGNGKFVAIASSSADTAFSYDGITWKNTFEYLSQNESDITESVRSVIGIPSCTTANNGQFLRVIDGIPTWTTIANAEGGTY